MADKKDHQKKMFFENDSSSSSAESAELLCKEKVDMRDVWKRRKIEHDAQQNARKPVFFSQQKGFILIKNLRKVKKDNAKEDVAQQDSDATKLKKAAVSRKPLQSAPSISKNIARKPKYTPTKSPPPPPPPSVSTKAPCDHKTAILAVASIPKPQKEDLLKTTKAH